MENRPSQSDKNSEMSEHMSVRRITNPHASGVALEDFQYIKTLGSGSFSEVFLVKRKETEHYFAMKVLYKEFLIKVWLLFN